MRMILLSVLIAAAFMINDATATTTELLPYSSHYQGVSHYSVPTAAGNISGRIDFAVYDTVANPDEFVGTDGFDAPGTGRFVYAYQIFSDNISTNPVEYFAIFGLNNEAVASGANIGAHDDGTGSSVSPKDNYLNPSSTRAVWEFENGALIAEGSSWFLLLRSDYDWVVGAYTLEKTPDDEAPVPNPEPATMALMGLGSSVLLFRRRKSRDYSANTSPSNGVENSNTVPSAKSETLTQQKK